MTPWLSPSVRVAAGGAATVLGMDELASPLVCIECGDVVPAPDLSEAEVREWKENHTAQTGHDSWQERPDVVIG